MRYRCPKCKSPDGLWEGVEVPGWRSVQSDLTPAGRDREVEWEGDVVSSGDFGCGECGWEGSRRQLEVVGIDGEPLPIIHPGQLTVSV